MPVGEFGAGPGQIDPRNAFAAAIRLHQAGHLAEAEAAYRQLLSVAPDHTDSLNLLGVIASQRGEHGTAIELIGRAISLRTANPAAEYHNNIGWAYRCSHRYDEAIGHFNHALALKPGYAEAHNNLGAALEGQGRLEEAEASIQRSLALRPDYAKAQSNLGVVFRAQDRLDDAFAAFARAAELIYGRGGRGADDEAAAPHKLRHDREQLQYLIETHPDDPTILHLRDAIANNPDSPQRFSELFAAFYRIEGGGRLADPAVNPNNDTAEIEARWAGSKPNIVVIDDLLTSEALAGLRLFCWGSTIWRKTYDDGYLGAFLDQGFACPLLAQITGELRAKFPGIIRRHHLTQCWAFKYDSALKGIAIHADFAAVNINFWIASDDANLDPAGGGLVIWDAPAPLDWNFDAYNTDENGIRDFLARSGAKSVTVPHRANRAVMFDSDLFHETDRIAFKEGYSNRRINVTLLYGLRHGEDGERPS